MSAPLKLLLALCGAVLVTQGACAQTNTTLNCENKTGPAERLACYEQLYAGVVICAGKSQAERLTCYDGVAERVIPEGGTVPGRKLLGWKVREKIGVDTVGDYAAEAGGAKFELGRSDGTNYSTSKVAALYLADPVGKAGWNPFYGIGWNRDSSDPTKRLDSREVAVGITGAAGSFQPTLLVVARKKLYSQAREFGLTAHSDLYVPALDYANKSLIYSLVPLFGLAVTSLDDNDATTTDGTFAGGYVGVRFEYKPKDLFPRVTVSGKLQAYADAKVPSGSAKRQTQYGSLSLGYDLIDPETKAGWVPAIKLSLQRGADPVGGEAPARKITLALTARYN